MRHITNSQKLSIYFYTPPIFIAEGFFIGGLVIPFVAYPIPQGFFGLLFLAVGAFFINRKIQTMKTGFYVLKHGMKTEAEITNITNTNWQHNDREIKEYNFQFDVDGRLYNYTYQSASKPYFQVGNKMTLFYIKDDPELCFIPRLYKLNIT